MMIFPSLTAYKHFLEQDNYLKLYHRISFHFLLTAFYNKSFSSPIELSKLSYRISIFLSFNDDPLKEITFSLLLKLILIF